MNDDLKKRYNALKDFRLPNVVRQIGLTGKSKDVALSSGLGDAIEYRRNEKSARAARRRAQKQARRRNR